MVLNRDLDLAWDFVNNTNRNVFLTGKAGTGKTTFLHKLKRDSSKRIVVVAPTGVAAINAKGVTIHSFFQLPFGPILPDKQLNSTSEFNRKFSKTNINIIKSLDVLVIDEISMFEPMCWMVSILHYVVIEIRMKFLVVFNYY